MPEDDETLVATYMAKDKEPTDEEHWNLKVYKRRKKQSKNDLHLSMLKKMLMH